MNENRSSPRSRALRRIALSSFPSRTLSISAMQEIASQGYQAVGIALVSLERDESWQQGEGWTLAQAKELASMVAQHDLGLMIFTGYMKYQEKTLIEQPHRAMVTCGAGQGRDSDGLVSRWLCPFQPENKRKYQQKLCEVAAWPAVQEIHLNDEAALAAGEDAIGCYCDYCTKDFHQLTGQMPPRTPNWDDDLWWRWLEYRMNQWVQVHHEFRQAIRQVAPDVAVGIQHSPIPACFIDRPWQSAISLARDAQALDLLATDPYHFIHSAFIEYRPHRRIQAEATRSLAGACLKRGVEIYPQAFMPPGRSTPLTRQDALLAGIVPFALGADTVIPYNYELSKAIPHFTEGLNETRRLKDELEKHTPYAYVTVLKPHQSEIRGHYHSDWGRQYLTEISDLMYQTGLPWRWFWDERLTDCADELEGPLIIPDAHCLTQRQMDVIEQCAHRGQGILRIGNRPQRPWSGKGPCLLPSEFHLETVELALTGEHDILNALSKPVMLCSSVVDHGPSGMVLGKIGKRPGLVISQNDDPPQAWLTGLPMHSYIPPDLHGATRMPTDGVALLRELVGWLAAAPPLITRGPIVTDYGKLRSWDVRDVPTVEMLPLVSEDSILAVMFPYVPCAYETTLTVTLPAGRRLLAVTDLWQEQDWTDRLQHGEGGKAVLPLNVPGSCELLALRFQLG